MTSRGRIAVFPVTKDPENRLIVLVVDDDPDILLMVKTALESEGYAVLTAGSGHGALQLLSKGLRPIVVLLDLMMPQMRGEDVVIAIRSDEHLAQIPVVAMSARLDAPIMWRRYPFDGLITKPFDLPHLLDCVATHARRSI
jgi:CheY-like chemotaxis protein